jgi:methylated-DNA-protein-cysteine methyltransferase-like protein
MTLSFKDKVYEFTRQIPKGKVATYGQLAKLAGKPKAARSVGVFMRINPDAPHTPCHRVVAADGSLTGYSGIGGIKKKRKLLLSEGVQFKGAKIDLTISGWSLVGFSY